MNDETVIVDNRLFGTDCKGYLLISTQYPANSTSNRKVLFILAMAYLIFVNYGSLIPLEFDEGAFSDAWWNFLSSANQSGIVSNQDTATNVLLSAPLAYFLCGAFAKATQRLASVVLAFAILIFCMADAAIIEVLQGFLPTRTSNVRDVWAQGIGASIGIGLWLLTGKQVYKLLNIVIPRYQQYENKWQLSKTSFRVLCLVYLLFLLLMNGYFSNEWLSFGLAAKKIADIHLAPFYGHYFASTVWATSSVMQYLAMYSPVGLICWLWGSSSSKKYSHELRLKWAVILAIGLALVLEAGKLFLLAKYPDTTNIFLAVTSSVTAFVILPYFMMDGASMSHLERDHLNADSSRLSSGLKPSRLFALLIWGLVLAGLISFSLVSWWLLLIFSISLYFLLRFPASWLLVVPALLPVFDFAPWSGRFFVNEFDLLLLTVLAAGLWHSEKFTIQINIAQQVKLACLLFCISVFISLLIGLLPFDPLDFNAFSNYYSRYNSLLAAKGFIEALAFVPLFIQTIRAGYDVSRTLSFGMVLGLAAAVIAGVWERAVFPGLFDFTSSFRISALFSSMHTGDSPVETYFVCALPFTLAWAYSRKAWWAATLALLLFMTGVYAIFVTFARGGYAAFIVSMLLLLGGIVFNSERLNARKIVLFPVITLFVFCAGLVAWPVFQGSFAQARLAMIDHDLNVRLAHWRNVLDIADTDLGTKIFGMGLGRFPETYFFRNPAGNFSATYQMHEENGNSYLSMGAGEIIYVEQIVKIAPDQSYKLIFDIRGKDLGAGFNIMLCERTFFESYNCQNFSQRLNQVGEWQHYQTELYSEALGQGAWFARRTTKLILENLGAGAAFDIDNIHLFDIDGNDVLSNGDFSNGMDRWFFSAFNHLAWHVKNIFVQLVFEQGWFGFFTFFILIIVILQSVGKEAWRGQVDALVILSSLVGFLFVGLFGSPLDAPRMAFLFYFLLFSGYLVGRSRRGFSYESALRDNGVALHHSDAFVRQQARVTSPAVKTDDSHKKQFFRNNSAADPFDVDHSSNCAVVENRTAIKRIWPLIGGLLGLIFVFAMVLNLPFVPYNIRELSHQTHPWLAMVFLSSLVIWTFGFPVFIAYLMTSPAMCRFYPLLLVLHGVVGWMLLSVAVPLESIHDIVGAPVLGWAWHWEIAGRFIALYSALSLTSTLVFLVLNKSFLRAPLASALGVWGLVAVLVYPICYEAIVRNAATDNLVELMADGGSITAVFFLSAFWALLNLSGYVLALSLMQKNMRSVSLYTLFCLGVVPLGHWLINQGLESTVVKFNTVFSGLQFLLSADRQHYLQTSDLMWGYVVFHVSIVLLLMFIHHIVLRLLRNFSGCIASFSLANK